MVQQQVLDDWLAVSGVLGEEEVPEDLASDNLTTLSDRVKYLMSMMHQIMSDLDISDGPLHDRMVTYIYTRMKKR